MSINKVQCTDKADVSHVVSMCREEGYFVSIDGLMVLFWR